MKFSIIIPTSDRRKKLKLLLDSILTIQIDASDYEVIVVENGKEETCKQLCNEYELYFNIKHIFLSTNGYAAAEARNIGISLVSSKLLLFFDDDVIVSSKCIKEHLNSHAETEQPKIVVGLRHNLLMDETITTKIGTFEEDYRSTVMPQLENSDRIWYYAYTCNLSVKFSDQKHYFDTNFKTWGNEDIEFAYRLTKAGFNIAFNRSCTVTHYTDSGIRSPFFRDKYCLTSDYKDFLVTRVYFVKKYWDDLAFRNYLIEDLRLYEFKNGKWIRNNVPDSNFDFDKFSNTLNQFH